jgi:general secretion pathway protein K
MTERPTPDAQRDFAVLSRRRKAPRAHAERGFVVVAVLWIIAALATFASIYAIYVANSATRLAVNSDRLQAEALISSAIELTAYRMMTADQRTRPTPGSFSVRMGRAKLAVEYRSESARIDLNAAPKPLLIGLFASLGAGAVDAGYYADRIIGWRTPGDHTGQDEEVTAYRAAGLAHRPRRAPFAHMAELWLVLGLPAHLVDRAMPLLTVYSGQPAVNVMQAEPQVLAALPGMTSDHLHAVLAQRGADPSNDQAVSALVGAAQGASLGNASKATRVLVEIDFDNGRRVRADVVILPLEDGDEPFRVLYWQDDFDALD